MDAATACDGLAMVAFGAGIIVSIPGIGTSAPSRTSPELMMGPSATILWILLFVAIIFMLAEVPLGGFAVGPDGTRVRVTPPGGG